VTASAPPRVAELRYVRGGASRVLVGRITHGPKSEIGRSVHMVVAKSDIPALRAFLDRLEASDLD
jgi:hypothetical protein